MDNTSSIVTTRGAMAPPEWGALRSVPAPVGDEDSLRPIVTEVLRRMTPPSPTFIGRRAAPVLPQWQINRVLAYICAHFDRVIHTEDLAALVRLSPFHFCRVFHATFGAPPHRHISRTRVECAKLLMRDTSIPLGQIAAECGMADQAHFNKLFRRFVGTSPGAWRRGHCHDPRGPRACTLPGQHIT
jgi:AraC-like DNA-binding protein